MPEKRATSRVERAIMLLTALKPDRMGAERARLLNKEQRHPFVLTHSLTHSEIRSDFLRNTHHQLNGKKYFALSARVPSFERDRPPGGPPLVTPQLNGGPARRAVNNPIWHRSQCCGVKWGARMLRARSVSREEVWASEKNKARAVVEIYLKTGAMPTRLKPF